MSIVGAISNGLKFDVSRTFLILFFSIPILFIHGILNIVLENSYGLFIFYSLLSYYFCVHVKGYTLFKSFRKISNNSSSLTDFKEQYNNYMNDVGYKKLRRNIYFLLGCSTAALIFIVSAIFS